MGNTYIMFICIYVILFGRRYLYILNNTDPHFQGKMFNKYNYKKKTDIGDVIVPLMLWQTSINQVGWLKRTGRVLLLFSQMSVLLFIKIIYVKYLWFALEVWVSIYNTANEIWILIPQSYAPMSLIYIYNAI